MAKVHWRRELQRSHVGFFNTFSRKRKHWGLLFFSFSTLVREKSHRGAVVAGMEETFELAFDSPPGANVAGIPIQGLDLPSPCISYGLPFYSSCAKHIKKTFFAKRVYIVASGSLSQNTDKLDRLIESLGREIVVGIRKGIAPHSLWSDILSIVGEAKENNVDCVVTLGAGSLTDAAKLVTFVSTSVASRNPTPE